MWPLRTVVVDFQVTVLNGHIHQLMQKVEGNVTFHTARSTAFRRGMPVAWSRRMTSASSSKRVSK